MPNDQAQTAAPQNAAGHAISASGKWTYRSYVNDTQLVGGDPNKALALIFGEGTMTLAEDSHGAVTGALDMGGGYLMTLTGQRRPVGGAGFAELSMVGRGVHGSPTDGWQYDYQAYPDPMWPKATAQVPTFVGTTIRAVPHNGEPAGVTASIIMVYAGAAKGA